MAWDLVNMVRKYDGALFDDAQLALDNLGYSDYDSNDINRIMSLLAYECIYQQLMLALNESTEDDDQ
jgi:hypothetical protein